MDGHGNELERTTTKHADGHAPAGVGALYELWEFEGAGYPIRCKRVRDNLAIETNEQNGRGADSAAVIGECRSDRRQITCRHRLAECEFGRQYTGGLVELVRSLVQEPRENTLTDVQVGFRPRVGIMRVGDIDQHERRDLHHGEERNEEHNDARAKSADAHQCPAPEFSSAGRGEPAVSSTIETRALGTALPT